MTTTTTTGAGGRSTRRRGGRGGLRLPVLLLATLLAGAAVAAEPITPLAPRAHADAAGGGGDYVPLSTNAVVLDTRSGTGTTTGTRAADSTTTFPVLGVGGVPTTGVGAVVVRVALIGPTAATWTALWPDGTTRPNQTMVSAAAGEDLSNVAVVRVGANGKLAIYNAAGKTHLVVEVQGYFKSAQGSTGGGFVPIAHTRVVDTRNGLGTNTGTIAAGGSRTLTLTGGKVPAGAAAAFVNVLVPGASTAGWLAVAPSGGSQRPLMNYETGSTQSGAVLTLPADGKVTIYNKGSAAVNVVLALEGYFAANPAQGAGLRNVTSRLLNTRTVGAGVPLAANATIDVQVGGTNGLPTRGIAGAVLNTVVTPDKAGYLKAWPVGEAEPDVSVMDFKADSWRDNAMVLKPGTDGKIRIRNGSSGTIHLIVDLQGWFADPLPAIPVAKDTRTTVMQAAPATGAIAGTLEYAYVDDSGRLRYGHQDDLGSFNSVQWTTISGNEAFTGQPALTQLADGRVQVSAQHQDGDIWTITQTAAGAATWTAWADFGGSVAGPPVVAKLGDNTAVQFAVDADGKLWAYAQTGAVPYWRNLGDQDLTTALDVVPVRDGVRVFGLNAQGAVKTVEYYNDGSVSAWTDLGGTGLTGAPEVITRPGYVLQVFVRGASGAIVTKTQDVSGAWPADWRTVGTYPDLGADTPPPAAGSPTAVTDASTGRISVVVRGTNSELYQVTETSTGSDTWGNWTKSVAASDPSATDPTALAYTGTNGASWLITFRDVNDASRIYDLKQG